jgi:glucose/arabinose dehydrogenase
MARAKAGGEKRARKNRKKLARPVEIWRQLPGRNSGARLTKRVLVGPKAVLVFSYGVHHWIRLFPPRRTLPSQIGGRCPDH